MTEKVYEELDNAKAEIEKLKSEYLLKSNLCDSLKRSHDDQIKKIQELNQKLEKQSQELEAKTDEIYASNQSLKDLESKLKDKENIIRSFTSTNEKLRVDFNSKVQETEEEKGRLLSSLDEANVKILELEKKNRDFMDKIEVLKEGIVSVSQKKCASESKVAKASKQMRERGDMFEKLEEEKVKLEEEIKWKNERFKHLEEAHEKVKGNLGRKEKEWEMEKGSFLEEISTLEEKLDSQITLSEDLKRRLEESNQALVYERDQRKSLIQEASNSSLVAKLQKKLKTLEKIHGECSSQSEVKEAEWRSKFEKMGVELNSCRKELEKKDAHLKKIIKELDDCNSLVLQLILEKEESLIMTVALKSTLLEAKSKMNEELESKNLDLVKVVADLNSCRKELEKKDICLEKITKELDDYTMEKEESLVMMVALKSTLLEAKSKINEELESKNLDLVKDQESIKESFLKNVEEEKVLLHKEMKKVSDLLDMANEELAERCCEINEVEFELQIWKSVAENLKEELEVNHKMRKELEASLLSQVAIEVTLKEENEEKDKRINELEQEMEELKKKTNTLLRFNKENGEKLEKEREWWEKEWVTKELENAIFAQLECEKVHEFEKKSLNRIVEEKDQRINDLQTIMQSLEEEFDNSSASFSSQLSKMQMEMNMFHEAWEKIRTNVVIKEIEVQERDLMIKEMEKYLEKMSLENEKLVEIIGGVSERINKLSREDGQMMGTLRSIMMSFDEKDRFDPVKENTNVLFQSPKRRNLESSRDHRSPLRALNS